LESQLPLHRLTPADWRELVDCYTQFASTRSGLNIRNEWQWKRVLGENRQLTIYAVGEPVEAYAVVSHVTAFWTTDHISEIAWSTRRGYDGLLSMLGGLAINKTALSWFEPSDGPFYSDYMDQGVMVTVDRPTMFRVTDVPGALLNLKPDPSLAGAFTLSVGDHLVEQNQGPFQVTFSNGKVDVEAVSTSNADFSLDIRNFAQALLGEPNLDDLARQGRVEVNSNEGFAAAKLLLPPRSVCCMDFF
jgi:predicted acetyltransferase